MESAETEPLECDPHPTNTVDALAGENKHHVTTITLPETEAFESDAHTATVVGFADPQAVGSEVDGDSLTPMKTEQVELDPSVRACNEIVDAQAGGTEHSSCVVVSGKPETLKFEPHAIASVSSVDLQASGNEHNENTVVSAERAVESNPNAVDVKACRSAYDDTMMAAAETEVVGCNSYASSELDFEVTVEKCTTNISPEAEYVQEKVAILIPGNEQEVAALTQSANMVSNNEGSFSSASPAGETKGDSTFGHIPIHNQEEIQGEEHVFDISEFDISAHDVPMAETFFGEHCMFPALDADKAEAWQGSEDDVILMESSCEHDNDQPGNRDAISMRASGYTIMNHEVVEGSVVDEKLVHKVPLQTSFDTGHGPNKSGGMNYSHVQGHEVVGAHYCNESDHEHAVIMKGVKLPPEDSDNPDAQEIRLQDDAEHTFVDLVEKSVEVLQPQNTSLEERCNTNNSVEEVENEGHPLNETHRDAAVHSVKLDHSIANSSLVMGVESTNSDIAATEEAQHLNTQDKLAGSRVDSFRSNEESITQALGNTKNECTDSESHEQSTCGQPAQIENDALLDERDSSNLPEAAFIGDKAELARALANSKEEDNVLVSNETSMEAVVPVEESLVQEEMITFNKNLSHEKVMVNDREWKVGPVVSHMEVNKLHIKQMQNLTDDLLCTGVKSVEGNVLDSRRSDVEEAVEHGGEVVEEKDAGPEEGKEEINNLEELCLKPAVETQPLQAGIAEGAVKDKCAEQANIPSSSDAKSVEVSDGNVLDRRQSDSEEIIKEQGGIVDDKHEEPELQLNDQDKLCSKQPADPYSLQAGIAGKETEDLAAGGTKISSSADGNSFEEADGNALESRENAEETIEDRGEVFEDKFVQAEQEKEEINELEQLCLKPSVDSHGLQASIIEEELKHDSTGERTNVARSSDAETVASACSNFTPMNEFPEGLKTDEKPVLQSLKPLGEESKEERTVDSTVGANSLSKKELEKHSKAHKSPILKDGNKLDSSIVQAKEGGNDDSDDGCSSEPEEELSDRKVQKAGNAFGIGDLVWAKVRSHPWWPAQIFDPADASKSARKAKKFGRVLVAFFGDCTFAWLQQSQMIAFRPNFKEKVKQTTLRIFCIAVEEALEEFCRRSELGLSCAHFKGSLHSTSSFPDANTGIREGVRVKRHKDFGSSVHMFRTEKTLKFIKSVACSPLGAWCSTLKLAELRGHVYGLRTCMVASGDFDLGSILSTIGTAFSHGSKLKRRYSSLETKDDADEGGSSKEANKMKDKGASDDKGLIQVSKKPRKGMVGGPGSDVKSNSLARKVVDVSEGHKGSHIIKFKVIKNGRRNELPSAERLPDTAMGQGVESEKSSDDGGETLLTFAGSSVKGLKRPSTKGDKGFRSLKKVHRQPVGGLQIQTCNDCPGSEAADSPTTEDALVVTSSLSEGKLSNAEVKRGKHKKKFKNSAWLPASSIDAEDLQEGTHQTKHSKLLKVGSRDETKITEFSKTSKDSEMKKEGLGDDREAGTKDAVRKFSRVGDSIRKVAGELTGTAVAKNLDNSSAKSTMPGPTIKLKDSGLKLQASPVPKKAASKEFTEDISLLHLRQDLELLANRTGGGMGKLVKHSKKGNEAETVTEKTSPQWQNVPHKTQKSCVQELALAARKRKSEMVHDEAFSKLPRNSSTTGSQVHHSSKAYFKGVEKPAEHRTFDKSLPHYSRRPALLPSSVKSSSPRYDEKLSSHMPLGLFMRFPEDFPLPSESQLKATFVPFGPLQMSATKLYHDSASAQVVFKHGRDAESAMKHAKKNAMFGPVSVTYRLRHLSQSSKVESKMDTPSPNNSNSSTPLRRPYLAKEKAAGPSIAPENRTGEKEVSTLVMRTSSNNAIGSGSEPTGDIQDQMMTLLRQVSVLVKPSPVGSDGT